MKLEIFQSILKDSGLHKELVVMCFRYYQLAMIDVKIKRKLKYTTNVLFTEFSKYEAKFKPNAYGLSSEFYGREDRAIYCRVRIHTPQKTQKLHNNAQNCIIAVTVPYIKDRMTITMWNKKQKYKAAVIDDFPLMIDVFNNWYNFSGSDRFCRYKQIVLIALQLLYLRKKQHQIEL